MQSIEEPDHEPRWAGMREIARMAGPAILSNLSWTLMQFVDMAMVARLGTAQLAAVGSAALWAWVVASLFVGLVSCVSTFVSQSYGRGDKENCARYTWQGIYIAMSTSIVGFVLFPLAPAIFGSMGHPADVTQYEIEYFGIRTALLFLIPWQAALSAFFMGINRPMVPMAVTVVANVTNIALDYALIFGKWGLPRLEVAGAAWATVASLAVQAVILQYLFLSAPQRAEYGSLRAMKYDAHKFFELIRIGWGAGFTWLLDVVTWGVFTSYVVGGFGGVSLAAHNAAIQVMHISFMPAIGLNTAIAPIVGQWIGRGNPARAMARTYTATRLAVVYMLIMGVTFAVYGDRILLGAFDASPEVVRLGKWLLVMAAVFQGFDAITIVMSGALRGAGDTRWQAVVMGLAAYFVFLPLAYSLAVFLHAYGSAAYLALLPAWPNTGLWLDWGAFGAWLGATAYIIGLSGLFFYRFYSEEWRKITIFVEKKAVPGAAPAEESA